MSPSGIRVLYVVDSLVGGGAETSLQALVPACAARGVDIEIAYLKERPGLHDEFSRTGARLVSLDGPGGRPGWISRTARVLRQRRPDLVHTTLFEADIAGRCAAALCRIPVVTSLVNEQYGAAQLADPRLKAWKVRAAQVVDAATARRVVRFHALTEHVADTMARRLAVLRDRIDVIGRGRDPEALGARSVERRKEARARLGVAADAPLILAAARQEYQKGLDILLEALPPVLERLPSTRLVVAGREGNASPTLRAVRDRLGLSERALFVGARKDVPDLMCAADVFVLPSRWEGLGSVLLEAMALGAPIVASDLPAVRELLDDGVHARLAAPGDPGALARALIAAVEHPRDSSAMAAAALERFLSNYTIDVIAERMTAFYERALAGSRARIPVTPS